MTKKRMVILCSILIMSLLIGSWSVYSWYHPTVYIDNFNDLESDYERVASVIRIFYDEQVEQKDLEIDISKADLHTLSYAGTDIVLSAEEQESLKKICESAPSAEYRRIIATEFDISFWLLEHMEYAMFYTTNLYETRKTVEKYLSDEPRKYASDKPKLKRINKNWYELI